MNLLSAGFFPLGRLFRSATPPPGAPPGMAGLSPNSAPPAPSAPTPGEGETASRKARVRRAFAEIPLGPQERRALAALLEAEQGATATELSRRCGWMPGAWRTQMLLLCQRRRHHFWPEGLGADITNGIILGALTDYDSKTLRFRARPRLKKILRRAVESGS